VVISVVDTAQVDTTRTIVGGTVTTREVDSLPNNSRSPLELIFTLGGVSEEALSTRDLANDRTSSRTTPEEAGSFSISGAPAYSNNITIDGLDNNDDRAARERFTPSLEAVDEVQLIRNQFAAEYGRASGGRLNLRTRSGASKFHGRAFDFFRDEALDANTWKNNSLGLKRLPLQEHDPGFTLSGPIVIPKLYNGQGRTFFFTAYEYDTLLDSTLVNTLLPVQQNALFALPAPTDLTNQRIENASAPALSAAVAPFISSLSTPSRNHTFTPASITNSRTCTTARFSISLAGLRICVSSVAAIAWPKRWSGKRATQRQSPISTTTSFRRKRSRNTASVFTFVAGGSCHRWRKSTRRTDRNQRSVKARDGHAGSRHFDQRRTDRREDRIQFQEVFSYAGGNHSLKFGGDLQRIKSTLYRSRGRVGHLGL
jgi:hypothetical protein